MRIVPYAVNVLRRDLTNLTLVPKCKEEWRDLIVENMVSDEDIDRIIENEELRNFMIDLRDNTPPITPEQILNRIINFTEDMKP